VTWRAAVHGARPRVQGRGVLHRNIIANVLQSEAFNQPVMDRVPRASSHRRLRAALYHIFAFTVSMMLSMRTGAS